MEYKEYHITKYTEDGKKELSINITAKGPKDALEKSFPDYAFEQYSVSKNNANGCKWTVGIQQRMYLVNSDCGKIWNFKVRNEYHNSLQGKTYYYSGRKDGKTIKELIIENNSLLKL
jgi:hypothetical protein